ASTRTTSPESHRVAVAHRCREVLLLVLNLWRCRLCWRRGRSRTCPTRADAVGIAAARAGRGARGSLLGLRDGRCLRPLEQLRQFGDVLAESGDFALQGLDAGLRLSCLVFERLQAALDSLLSGGR